MSLFWLQGSSFPRQTCAAGVFELLGVNQVTVSPNSPPNLRRMSTARRFFETFDLALGRLLALVFGVIGGFLVYAAWHIWGDAPTTIMFCIGLGLLLVAGLMLYYRVTFFGLLEFFAPTWWS